ncbi:hypothetical protein NBO_176g0001 [Nosema bombycis CQ1]|uniref:Uncharacterized protein n=1 Tax=Nosema bombycis (strain CQ1 / CVCC 102059) TaxID=578461 RepID=R0M526_NOSB1|nr:hypothetical protein NBO_176g0001 [Nosema bombycis CQ1]|eukprot:EOB13109.1 hypothetical protein NBO_176g0001 [Nosema bombycis CQ1]
MQSGLHPVRQAHEFTALVQTGRSTGPDYELCLWEGDHFAATDLIAYLDGELLIADHLAAMEPSVQVYPFGDMSLSFDTWTLNQELHTTRMVQRYPKAESSPGE